MATRQQRQPVKKKGTTTSAEMPHDLTQKKTFLIAIRVCLSKII